MRPKLLAVTIRMALSAAFILPACPGQAKRLSDWLLAKPRDPHDYPLGLVWEVPSEKPYQNEIRYDILKSLSGRDPDTKADPAALSRMRKWVESMPVTGRVPVASADPAWLEANPDRDPVISPGDRVLLPGRPETVTVVKSDGTLCRVRHSRGYFAADYAKRCSETNVDWVYVAQPDGKTMRFGIGLWNGQRQVEPAPGAWIWAPRRGDGWPEKFSEKLVAFLATQGPSPDASPLTPHPLPAPSRSAILQTLFPDQDLSVTANDWGEAGIFQTPSARMREEGDFSFSLSRAYPYTRGNVFFQPLSWMEAGFRYTNLSNHLYGPTIAGTQADKDKSVEMKFRLLQETAYFPQLAAGSHDIAGTGIFSGEYLVASKRTGPFDWSLGLGWGNVGARGDIGNPLGSVISSFNTRNTVKTTQGGSFSFSSYFHGPAALFGGVQYQTPWEPLILKLEYEGNNYQHEPFNNLAQASPWNFGAVYRANSSLDISAGLERGNTPMLSFTLHTSLRGVSTPKLDDPPAVPVHAERPEAKPDWKKTSSDIADQTGWHVGSISENSDELRITVDDASGVYWKYRLDRAVAVLQRDAPADVDRFAFVYREKGIEVAEHRIDRNEWVAARTRALALSQKKAEVIAAAPEKDDGRSPIFSEDPPFIESKLGMNFNYNLGGPNGFILYQFAPDASAKLRFDKSTWLQGDVQLDVLDNFSKFTYTAPSNLPRVRTYLREYMTSSRFTMPNLQLTHVGSLGENQYYSLYGGYLEEMFAGFGGEWLYRPFESNVAFGVDVNEVQQRNFVQDFGLQGYRVLTGHGTLYWDTGWNDILAKISAGRYLAGDIGATFDLSRVFENGMRMGAFFTKTNVSAAQFGEGSFDKGIYLTIPFDAMLTRSSNTVGNFVWRPLTRDGGAMLARRVELYDLTKARDARTLEYRPAPPPEESTRPEDLPEKNLVAMRSLPELEAAPRPTVNQWNRAHYEERMRDALYLRGFRNIGIALDKSSRLSLSLSCENIRPMSRAAGIAARIALLNSPLDVREISIACDNRVIYDFFDANRLKSYFSGEIPLKELKQYAEVVNPDPTYREADPFGKFADVELSDRKPTLREALLPEMHPVDRVKNDFVGAAKIAANTDWVTTGAIGAGLILGSSLLDRSANTFALKHASNSFLRNFDAFGNALPWVESAGAALAALGSNDPELSRTGYAASEAAVTSFGLVLGLKTIVGRARPYTGQNSSSFHPFAGSASNGTDGFPSGHTIVAWSVITPFAEEYRMPWLYGVAALTNLSRIGSRNHWVSDTVAGSFLGYGIGKYFWESSRLQKNGPHVFLSPNGVDLSWDMP